MLTYAQSDELHGTSTEANPSQTSQHQNEPDRVTVEFEPNWLREEHGADESSLGGVES